MIQLYKFYADWCGPCQILKETIDKLKEEYTNTEFVEIDIEKQPDFTSARHVMSVPTVIILEDGKEITRIVGAQQKEAYIPFLK